MKMNTYTTKAATMNSIGEVLIYTRHTVDKQMGEWGDLLTDLM